MAITFKSVLAAARAILQTKTVTAGTSAQTVTPDSGYDGLESVTVNPTPSQSKSATPTTSSQTITPDSGKLLSSVSVGAIPSEYIIPSGNKSITSNGTGIDIKNYATASVDVPNPTLSGDATAADVKSGKTFYNSDYTKRTGTYVEPTIENVTVTSSTQKVLTKGANYHIDEDSLKSGVIVGGTISAITPSDDNPQYLSNGNNYYKPSAIGYAISSYTSISQSQLDAGIYFSSGMKKMASSGYAYSSPAPKVATGYIAGSTSSTTTVNCGFKPKFLCVENKSTGNNFEVSIYDENVSTTQIRIGSNGKYISKPTMPVTTTNEINSLTDTGFILNKISSSSWPGYYYFAIG